MSDSKPFFIHYFRPPSRELEIESELLYSDDEVIVTSHILRGASKPLAMGGETVIDNGYRAVFAEYRKEWFDVAGVFRPDGTFTGYYADINTPSESRPDGYWTKDLFLDLWIPRDRSKVYLLDEDEFEEACRNQWITDEEAIKAKKEVERLMNLFEKGEFPPALLERFL
jgi:predicted RNA-binding protein associated with RNAse of E/G family